MINIFFGKVVDVNDDEKIFRIRATIAGYTDKLNTEDLPMYYPFFGIEYLPIVGDEVAIFIFNGNFTTGFYNKKVNWSSTGLEGSEYENYLEIYKRLGIELSYKESVGIQLININSRLQIENGKASMYVEDNQITMNKSRIDLGTDGEATPLGDKTVKAFNNQIDNSKDIYSELITFMEAIKNASTSPMLKPIRIALTPLIPRSKSKINPQFPSNKNWADNIQSKKTFIE